jgi:carboxylate-amine ligase
VTIRKIGIEEEFLVFEQDAPRLSGLGPRVVEDAHEGADDDAQFEKELKQAQAELATRPETDLDRVAAELDARRRELAAAAAERGVRLVASGTSPVSDATGTTDDDRYREMARIFGAVQERQLTCAMHVHVDVDSEDLGVRVLNGIAPWLPALTALSTNSPFHAGRDTGYASFRRVQWGQWPTSGPTQPFADAGDYHRTVRDLVTSGAARDEGMIYFDARLSANYPTVEIRVCDVAIDTGTAVALAALARALVATTADVQGRPAVRTELLRAAQWRAARYGMAERLVALPDGSGEPELVAAWDLVSRLLDAVGPALDEAGDRARVQETLDRLRRDGTGAQRQRAAADRAGLAGAVDAATLSP